MLKLCEIYTLDKLLAQADILKKKRFKPGIDGMSAEAAELWLQINGKRLLRDILDGRYSPMPAKGFVVAKQSGHYRQLAKLTALDTILQQCLLEGLMPPCEALFSTHSFAYRPGRGVGAALQQYCLLGDEFAYAAKLDPVTCYDCIDRNVLKNQLQRLSLADEAVLKLIMEYAAMPVLLEGRLEAREAGILQGAPLSPLLCNLYFHPLDQFLEARETPFIRYADDIVLFGKNLSGAGQSLQAAEAYLVDTLKLKVNESTTNVAPSCEQRFLGHQFSRDRQGMLVSGASESPEGVFYAWNQKKMRNTHRTMDILSSGVLRQKEFSLLFEGENQKMDIPMMAIDVINIYSSVVFDSGFLKRALENNIHINLFDPQNHLVGRFLPNCTLKAPMVTHEQIEHYYDNEKRALLARQFLLASIHNLRLVIRYYKKQSPNTIYELSLAAIKDFEGKIKNCEDIDRLLILEANVRREYYECFDFMIKSNDFVFEKRTRMPPKNEINALISFGNTVLYNIIAFKINQSPLDIRIGYLHSTNGFRKESLNLDVAEVFRPLIVDRVIFSLLNLKSIKSIHFRQEKDGAVYLTEDGKRAFLKGFYDKLDEGVTVRERYYTYNMLMNEEIRKLVRHFRNAEPYRAYRQVR